MEVKKVLLIKYGEISLRKGNRRLYEQRLIDTIRRNIQNYGNSIHVTREQGRLLVEDMRGDIDESLIPGISLIFGITAVCLCLKTEMNDLECLCHLGLACIDSLQRDKHFTFKVETKRGDKRYPILSQEVSAAVGGYIAEHNPLAAVDVHQPEVTLWIEIRTHTYLYTHAVKGEAGLPYGASGKGVLLLSGGIDSPVAGYMMARRGVEIVPVYFHSPPYTSQRAADKAMDLVARLSTYTGYCKLYTVPFTEVQLFLYERVQPEKLTLLLRRAMLRIATSIAHREDAHCLITGDSVGQVASQTVRGLEAVDSAAGLPVLRPLCGIDKQSIIHTAQRIGTYDISIRPYTDCCTLFVAEHPENKPKASIIEAIEARLNELPELYKNAVDKTVLREYGG